MERGLRWRGLVVRPSSVSIHDGPFSQTVQAYPCFSATQNALLIQFPIYLITLVISTVHHMAPKTNSC